MTAKKERPPGGAHTGTDTETGFQRGYYTASARKPQEENAPVRETELPKQADRGAENPSLNRSLRPYPTTTAGGRQDDTARYGTNIFQAVKDAVTVTDAAALYGFSPNRAGFIRCPFHGGGNEKTPSCHLKERYFKCFACQTGGSVVDFTARLFNLSPLDAVKRLNADFRVGLSLDAHAPTPQELEAARKRQEVRDAAERFETWRQSAIDLVSCAIGVGNDALIHRTPDEWTETEVYAIKQKARLESFVDDLEAGDDGKQLSSLRDWGEVYGIASRICRE